MEILVSVNDFINGIVWGPFMIALIAAVGLYFTVRLGFFQFRNFGFLLRQTVGRAFRKAKGDEEGAVGDITSFQAAMTSVAAIVGSGNIAGVATAIVCGGPGALLWMLLAAFLGMATKFAEIALGIRYRRIHPDGSVSGGAMYYLADGLKQKWLGILFSVLVIFFAIMISAVVDTNTIALAINARFPSVQPWVVGLVLAVLTGIIIFGGIKRIGRICEFLAPFMGGLYILAGIAIILLHIRQVPEAISLIFRAAFSPRAATGGVVGSVFVCMRYGVARGIFSNEAGLGSAAMVHSAAKVKEPVEQAVWGPVEVFLDTVLVCTVSALTIVLSGLWDSGLDGAALTMSAFDKMLPGSWGGWICLVAVVLFGFSCLISFYTYAERAAEYIFGAWTKWPVRVIWVVMIFIGSLTTLGLAWDLADTCNGLMILPNLIGLVLLSNQVIRMKKEYFSRELSLERAQRLAKKTK
jgi:AGCS family alanine or glycine:cation symporter